MTKIDLYGNISEKIFIHIIWVKNCQNWLLCISNDNTQALRSEEVIQDKHTSTDNTNMQHNMINEIRGILNLVKK